MGHKMYMLVGDVEVPYKHHKQQDSLKLTFFYRFLCSFWWSMLAEANHRQYVKIDIFNMAAMKKYRKNGKWKFPKILTITDKQNLHINVIVENYNEISW